MRILTVDLQAFGPFTKVSLDLSGGQEGLHIIYGLNEAGKSAALRALKALFYGIDHQTKDNFLHDNRNLKIGATIRHSDKAEFAFIRRKGTKNTLLDTKESPIVDSALQKHLGGVTREQFSTLFGINHEILAKGGMLLVAGGGDLGESLFAAGTGVTGLRDALHGLQKEADDLFTPRGSTKAINSLMSRYKAAKKKSSELSLSSSEWADHDAALREAMAEKKKINDELTKLRTDERRLDRMQQAFPIITERRELSNRLDELKDVPLLDPSFPNERRSAISEMNKARSDARKAEDDLNLIGKQQKELSVPEPLILQSKVITELHKRLGSHLKAHKDLPALEGQREVLQADATKILSELRPGLDLQDVELLRLTETKRIKISDLGGQHQALLDDEKRTTETLDELETDLARTKEDLQRFEAPRDPSDLRFAIRRALKQGDLEERLRTGRARLKDMERQANVDLKALPLWSGMIEDLEALPTPSSETIDRFSFLFDELKSKTRNIEDRIKRNHGEIDKLDKQIKTLQITGSVPTEPELIRTRERRDSGWALVLRAWLHNEDVREESKALDPEASLDKAYEKDVKKADDLADRLRREAKRVEKLAQLLAAHEQGLEMLGKYKEELDGVLEERFKIETEWNEHWTSTGIKPQSPREMAGWLKKQEQIISKAKSIREDRGEVGRLEKLVQEYDKDLRACLGRLGQDMPAPDESLNSLIDHCQALVDEIEEKAKQRRNLEKEAKALDKRRSDAERKRKLAHAARGEWKEAWGKAISELGLSNETSPSQANAFITKTQDLFEKIDKKEGFHRRIQEISMEAEQFEADVKSLLKKVAPDLLELPVNQSVENLNERLGKAGKDAATLKQLEKQQGEKEKALREANVTIREKEDRLEAMCRKAGCSDYNDLEKIEPMSTKKRNLMDRITQLESELQRISHGGGMTTDELNQETEKVDPDELTARIEEAKQKIKEQQNRLSEIDNRIGGEERELKKMDGSAEAAEAAEQAKGILAQIQSHTEQYMVLRTAYAILSHEIERYREANQDPILQRASQLFSELTSASFSGIKPSYDERDNPILLGIRPSGEEVTVDGMSDGTCDQLYLSLRLASLEKHLEENEPMPLIIDDILINFDDDRAKATLRLIAELSNKTQIIFFTHHQHLVELAETNVNEGVLFTHTL
ncbi:MAG: hypothetical protein BA872_08870 [Desulfobacterales bacterium C00003060]|nr:MAG: hypothetical protein BA872_08870 [Desulfobacterales bacterium C00003060]